MRGLDYYTRATFEIQTGELGAQSAVAGGGRYDKLVRELGGPDLPATGFAIGFDRLAEIVGLRAEDYRPVPDVFVAALGERCRPLAFEWCCRLGREGVRVEMEFGLRSLKALMKAADRLGAAARAHGRRPGARAAHRAAARHAHQGADRGRSSTDWWRAWCGW